MVTKADNTTGINSSVANNFTLHTQGFSPPFKFADNTPRTLMQRKMQANIGKSDYSAKATYWQSMAGKYVATTYQRKPVVTGIIQRYLNAEGRLPDEDKNLDDLLASIGYDDVNLFSQADYNHLEGLHNALIRLDDDFDERLQGGKLQEAKANIRHAFDAVDDYAKTHYLEDGTAEWTRLAGLGADHMEQNAGVLVNAAALAVWAGRGAHPVAFEAAITDIVNQRQVARQAAINAAYAAYNNGRLLPGTINAIRQNLGAGATLAEVNARLALVYQRQCQPTRQNWLSHLGIAGNAIDGNGNLHFTTFNDSVPNPLNIRVDLRTRDEIMDDLFNAVPSARQLHATKVHEGTSYHKYYDLTYIPAGGPPAVQPLTQLNNEYTRMITVMRDRVTAAKNSHGRIHHNAIGQQLNVGP